jgi:redox-sensitive bicupin YhaK (pirin superfamily)
MGDPAVVELTDAKPTEVGGIPIHRALPRHGRRTVGAWCFLDRLGPIDPSSPSRMAVGPHPHIGLHTVTWLLQGEVAHSDSLENRQLIRPGQLNLMSAGHGISHAEDARLQPTGALDGVQLWVAQSESTRHTSPSFVHLDVLPEINIENASATILIGGSPRLSLRPLPLNLLSESTSPAVDDRCCHSIRLSNMPLLDWKVRPEQPV